jgi:hypothetical protein
MKEEVAAQKALATTKNVGLLQANAFAMTIL